MVQRSSIRLYGMFLAALLATASTASAQLTPEALNDPATGEKYHIEGSAGFWMPSPNMNISSESLGIIGSKINFQKDLGLTSHRFRELNVVGRPSRKSKIRFQYIPIKYVQSATLTRDITFN